MPRIVIENGPDRGRSYLIQTEGAFFAGRDPAAQVPIRDEMASRRHFQIDFRDGRFQMRDLESKNGVLLNGHRLEGISTLSPNDRIQVGDTLLTFVGDNPHPLLGREVSGYRIEDRIGRGGMGTVYRALQLSLDRTVAMKILAPHLVENQNFINLFIREARAAGALSHPNLVQVYDVGVEEEIYFYSMEYIPHGSVEELLNQEKRIPVSRALEIVRDAALGLQYAELKGLVHRDIKPGNLMIGTENIVKIGDLGIARFGEEEGVVSQKDGVSGSPHYIAPEQARGLDIDHRADLYALGVSFYQMLCGETPYRGSTPREVIMGHLRRDPPPLIERAPETPAAVVELVEAMMHKDRDERVPSATAILERLEPLLRRHRGEGDLSPAPGEKSKLIAKLVVGFALLGAVAIGSTLAVLARQDSIAEEEKRIEVWTQLFADAEADQALERAAAVGTALEQLKEIEDLPPDLAERRAALESWLIERREREEAAAQARFLEEAFETLEKRVATLDDEAALVAWDEFTELHPGTEEAEEAQRRRTMLAAAMLEAANREQSAELRIRPKIKVANDLAREGDFRRALETLEKTQLPGTAADADRLATIERIEEEARAAWAELTNTIRDRLADARFSEARLAIQRFRAPPFLAGEITALLGEVENEEARAGEDTTDGPDTDLLGVALSKSLSLWATGEGGRAATDAINDFELLALLDENEKAMVRAAVDLMKKIPDFIDGAGEKIDRTNERVTLGLIDGGTQEFVVKSFNSNRINGTYPRETRGRIYNWSELTPASRLAVLATAESLPRDQFPLYGWFAFANGDRPLAEQIWGAAEAAAKPLIAQLRTLADRAERAND